MKDIQLANLIRMDIPQVVLDEIQTILALISPTFNTTLVTSAFDTVVNLYEGNYSGYQACNTGYHDLRHITDTFLTMARLLHGAVLNNEQLSERHISLAVVASLFHDAGYIQREDDTEGTGGKYTAVHVRRSMDFLSLVRSELGLSKQEVEMSQTMLLYTDLAVDFTTIKSSTAEAEILGKMLGVADLVAQISDRTYLEKLFFLYHEFKEGQVGNYEDEIDLLRKTVDFYDSIVQRIETMLPAADRFLKAHFTSRWQIKENLYTKAIKRQKNYLQSVIQAPDFDPSDYLKRSGIVDKARQQYRGTSS